LQCGLGLGHLGFRRVDLLRRRPGLQQRQPLFRLAVLRLGGLHGRCRLAHLGTDGRGLILSLGHLTARRLHLSCRRRLVLLRHLLVEGLNLVLGRLVGDGRLLQRQCLGPHLDIGRTLHPVVGGLGLLDLYLGQLDLRLGGCHLSAGWASIQLARLGLGDLEGGLGRLDPRPHGRALGFGCFPRCLRLRDTGIGQRDRRPGDGDLFRAGASYQAGQIGLRALDGCLSLGHLCFQALRLQGNEQIARLDLIARRHGDGLHPSRQGETELCFVQRHDLARCTHPAAAVLRPGAHSRYGGGWRGSGRRRMPTARQQGRQ